MKERRFSSENISFRLQKVHLNQLREEAVQKRISLNTLANQIIDSYVNYSSNLSKADVIPFTKYEIMILLEGYSEEQIKGYSRTSSKENIKGNCITVTGKIGSL